jgi:ABC-type dipeptide/oligopeptide/nickel transport system ATPase component
LGRRHKNTCQWLLDGEDYSSWRTTPSSFFWLHGLSGCGKTVLASSVIQQLQSEDPAGLIAYHYFDVNGGGRRDLSQMLRSLLYQLAGQHPEARQILQALYVDCGMGAREPTVEQLSEQFTSVLEQSDEVTVILDALDESDSPDSIVSWVSDLHHMHRDSLRLFVTSRKQGILDTTIDKWLRMDQIHAVQVDKINRDIEKYVDARLFSSEEFEKWNSQVGLREHVMEVVLQRADGM